LLYILHFCQQDELTAKALLLFGNAPCFPAKNLCEVRMPLDVNIVYMPSNSTSLFQPTDKGVIKPVCYFCQTFMEMERVLDRSDKLSRIIGAHSTF